MTDTFDGDPLVVLTEDGADMIFTGGQCAMDQGFLNHVNFSLLTEKEHWSEDLIKNVDRKYNGAYMVSSKKPITRQMLIDTSRAAEQDVRGDEFRNVIAETTNPASQNINTEINYEPPSRDKTTLRLERSGENWISQAENPQNDLLNEA